ncbi:hypothetical protein ANN_11201 [Periplaneta americana]|uniref:Uncharacterized protein n=1 Tax=Periplaneta americana TaxID=6978 RepID=A0ABQ8T5R8_PERAM|nr:hypothetical protein ANN_11201 [Periplaneta americana]
MASEKLVCILATAISSATLNFKKFPYIHEASDHSSEALLNRLDDTNISQTWPGLSGINEPKTPRKPVEKQTTSFVTPADISPVPIIEQKIQLVEDVKVVLLFYQVHHIETNDKRKLLRQEDI